MIEKTAAAAVTALLLLAGGSALAATPPAAPPMSNGNTYGRGPKTPTVAPSPTELRAGKVIGTEVHDAYGKPLAKIRDLILDRRTGRITLAILKATGGHSFKHDRVTVAWHSLHFTARPTPRFFTRLSPQAVANGTPFRKRAEHRRSLYDVKDELLGKQVLGSGGKPVGDIADLVFDYRTGKVKALVIAIGQVFGAKRHAVAWTQARLSGGKGKAPLRVALAKAQVDAAPVTTTMAPRPAAQPPAYRKPVVEHNHGGDISGTTIPAPAVRR